MHTKYQVKVATVGNLGMTDRETQEQRTDRFMRNSLMIGTILGVVAGSLYAMSDFNPNQGKFLSLEVNLMLFSGPVVCLAIGWVLSRI